MHVNSYTYKPFEMCFVGPEIDYKHTSDTHFHCITDNMILGEFLHFHIFTLPQRVFAFQMMGGRISA